VPGASYAEGRKHHVGATVEEVVALVAARGIATPTEVAEALDVSLANATGKLTAGVARGVLICDDHDADGCRLTAPHHRYAEAE
jgi:hypothetical protein